SRLRPVRRRRRPAAPPRPPRRGRHPRRQQRLRWRGEHRLPHQWAFGARRGPRLGHRARAREDVGWRRVRGSRRAAAQRRLRSGARVGGGEERIMQPRIQYTNTNDGVRIAYWVMGQGTPIVIVRPEPASDNVNEKNVPERWGFYQRLAEHATIVRYDPRGCGMSDRE